MSRFSSWQLRPRRLPSSCTTRSVILTLAYAGMTSSSNSSITAVATNWAFDLYASLSHQLPEFFLPKTEVDWMVVWNAMACALDMAHPSGSQKARQLSQLIPQFDDWSDPFQLRLRLKLALLERSYEDANKIIFEIGPSQCY